MTQGKLRPKIKRAIRKLPTLKQTAASIPDNAKFSLVVPIVFMLMLQIVVLSPGTVERAPRRDENAISSKALARIFSNPNEQTLAPGIPTDKIPDESVRNLDYTSSRGTVREWRILGKKANFYKSDSLVHAREVEAYLYEGEDTPTLVVGREAKYNTETDNRELEVFGDVRTLFPDGFTFYSDYLKYFPMDKKIHIPIEYPVKGESNDQDDKKTFFDAMGLDSYFKENLVFLHKDVRFTMTRQGTPRPESAGVADFTTLESDKAKIVRNEQVAYFVMNKERPLQERFVRIFQPNLFIKGRRARLHYGDFSKLIRYMSVFEDVFLRELSEESDIQYATCGRADFDSRTNMVILTELPQAYEGGDTITGDIIRFYRDTDVVEVEHSNAFSEGNKDR